MFKVKYCMSWVILINNQEKKNIAKKDNSFFQYSMVTRYNYSKLVKLNLKDYINI